MNHIGIDLGARHSHVVEISSDGEMTRTMVATPELPRWLAGKPPSRVAMEACTQSPRIAGAARTANHETYVVPGQVVRALGVGARGIKTDYRDAEVLATASLRNPSLPSVHLRSEPARAMRELISTRASLVKARTALSTAIKCTLRAELIVLRGRASAKSFATAMRKVLESRKIAAPHMEPLLVTFEHLSDQIEKLNEQVAQMAEADVDCRRSMKIAGVGPQVSMAFKAQIDDPRRFASSDELASYLALSPGESTTGGKIVRTATIKAGPKHLKALLVQAAWSLWRSRPNEPMVVWAQRISEKRGKRIAVVALARKLATVIWSMWKHGRDYEPARAARVITATPT